MLCSCCRYSKSPKIFKAWQCIMLFTVSPNALRIKALGCWPRTSAWVVSFCLITTTMQRFCVYQEFYPNHMHCFFSRSYINSNTDNTHMFFVRCFFVNTTQCECLISTDVFLITSRHHEMWSRVPQSSKCVSIFTLKQIDSTALPSRGTAWIVHSFRFQMVRPHLRVHQASRFSIDKFVVLIESAVCEMIHWHHRN